MEPYPSKIKLEKDTYATQYYGVYQSKKKALIISDLHVGFEYELARRGSFVPKTQVKVIKEKLERALKELEVKHLILNGDVKHTFGRGEFKEYKELTGLFEWLESKFEKVSIVKGNHDNYLQNSLGKFPGIEFHERVLKTANLIITHGDKEVTKKEIGKKTLIMGHQHPSIVLRDEIGASLKLPCFLHKSGDNPVIITPAISPLSGGADFLTPHATGFLGKTLKREGTENFTPIAVSEFGLLKLPKLGVLQERLGKTLYFEKE